MNIKQKIFNFTIMLLLTSACGLFTTYEPAETLPLSTLSPPESTNTPENAGDGHLQRTDSAYQECHDYDEIRDFVSEEQCFMDLVKQDPGNFLIWGEIGRTRQLLDNWNGALDAHFIGLALVPNKAEEAIILQEISFDYLHLEDFQSTITYGEKALAIEEIQTTRKSHVLLYIGLAYRGSGDAINACKYIRQAYDLSLQISYEFMIEQSGDYLPSTCP